MACLILGDVWTKPVIISSIFALQVIISNIFVIQKTGRILRRRLLIIYYFSDNMVPDRYLLITHDIERNIKYK